MAQPYRTSNPLDFTKLEGVIVSEQNPVPSVIRAGANAAVFIAQFEKGLQDTPQRVGSISEMQSYYGANQAYGGNKALRLKGWSNLYVTRAVANDAVAATTTQTVATKNLATFTAKYKGKYGNNIKVVITDGTNATTKKITVTLGNEVEVFDNLSLAGMTDTELAELFRTSKLIVVTAAHVSDNISNAELDLATGSDGNISSTDYDRAIKKSNINVAGKVYFTDDQSAGTKSALANFIKSERNGICVLGASSLDDTVATVVADASTLQDTEGRVLYAYNPVKYNILGVIEEENPVFLVASLLNLSAPNVSPSAAQNSVYAQTAVGVKNQLTRTEYITLREAGIMALEDDQDLGVRIRSSVTGSNNWSVIRRRMNDFLVDSLARYLKNYQNQPNSLINRASIKSAIISFDEQLVADGILPTARDAGVPVLLVQTEGTTTPDEQAQGIQKIVYKRRIFAELKFIVLETTVGESVTVENVEGA